MKKIFTFLLLAGHLQIRAINFPADNALLYQTQVMFQWDEITGADFYRFTLYAAAEKQEPLFVKDINSLALLVTDKLQAGGNYAWQFEAVKNNKVFYTSQLYNFTISILLNTDTAGLKFQFTVNTKKNLNACIFLDGCGAAINYAGQLVWKMNEAALKKEEPAILYRNIELNSQGQLSFIVQSSFYETDLAGNILWKAPLKSVTSNETVETYHHDGRRLKDGNYLIASYRYEVEPSLLAANEKCKIRYNTLLLFSPQNKLLWWWNEKGHVKPEDLYLKSTKGSYEVPGTHLNGFDLTKNEQKIILSFRDNNRMIIIDRQTGHVLQDIKPNVKNKFSFGGQHSPVFINENKFVFYNNNLTKEDKEADTVLYASVIAVKNTKNKWSKDWEYVCKSDSFPNGTTGKEGYCQPLPNGNFLICAGGKNWLLEVTPQKKIVWECYPVKSDEKGAQVPLSSYRAHLYSSLYPNFFTVQYQLADKINTGKKFIKINNDGTDDDRYEVILEQEGIIKKLVPVSIKAGQSKLVYLPAFPFNNKLIFTVTVKPFGVEGKSFSFGTN